MASLQARFSVPAAFAAILAAAAGTASARAIDLDEALRLGTERAPSLSASAAREVAASQTIASETSSRESTLPSELAASRDVVKAASAVNAAIRPRPLLRRGSDHRTTGSTTRRRGARPVSRRAPWPEGCGRR